MKHTYVRCLLTLLCLALSLGMCSIASAEGYIQAIPPRYDETKSFSEGLAAVLIDDKWALIDKTGKEVMPPMYDAIGDFSDGLARVRVGDQETGKWGFIDKTGGEVVPPKYDDVSDFHNGLAMVMLDDLQNEHISLHYFRICLDGSWGFIDRTGKEVVPPKYDWAGDFYDGLAMVFIADRESEDGKWGFIDRTGKEVVPVIYDEVGEFREGRAAVCKDGKLGFVDETGSIVIPLTYMYQSDGHWLASWYREVLPFFSEGLAAVWNSDEHGDQYGYIDRDGNVVIPFEFSYAAPFSEGLAYVSKDGRISYADMEDGEYGHFGYINKTGEVVVPLIYDCDYSDGLVLTDWRFTNGFAQVRDSTQWKYGMIDKTGAVIVPFQYDWITNFHEGLAFAGLGKEFLHIGEWDSIGAVDKMGKEIVPVGEYEYIWDFYDGFALVGRCLEDGSSGQYHGYYCLDVYGFIDPTGNEVVPCILEGAHSFSEGLAAVLVDGKWGYIAISK